MVSLTHEQNIIFSQIQLDDIAHESRGRLSANEKEDKFASNDNGRYFHVISCIFRDIFIETSALMAYIPLCGSRGVVRKNNHINFVERYPWVMIAQQPIKPSLRY